MLRLLTFTFCILLLSTTVAFSDDRPLALIRQIQGVEILPPALSRQLERVGIQIVSKQKGYQLVLSGEDTPSSSLVDMVAIESEVAKSGTGYRIEARLLDLKTQKLLTKASHDNIREEDVIRLYQGALESLFIPDVKKEIEATPAPFKTPNPKINNPKNPPPALQVRTPNEKSIDFKKRVKELKFGVDEKIKIVNAEEKKKEAEAKENQVAAAKAMSAQEANVGQSEDEPEVEKKKASKNYPKKMVFLLGWESRSLLSTDLVDTSSEPTLLTLRAMGHMPLDYFSGQLAYSFDVSVSRALSSAAPLPTPYQLGLAGSWLSKWWATSLGLHRDTSFFFNVPAPGAGLQTSMITTLWSRLQGEAYLGSSKAWKMRAAVGNPIMVSSGHSSVKKATKWEGTNFLAAVAVPLFSPVWETQLSFEKINLTTEGTRLFTINESRLTISVGRLL